MAARSRCECGRVKSKYADVCRACGRKKMEALRVMTEERCARVNKALAEGKRYEFETAFGPMELLHVRALDLWCVARPVGSTGWLSERSFAWHGGRLLDAAHALGVE